MGGPNPVCVLKFWFLIAQLPSTRLPGEALLPNRRIDAGSMCLIELLEVHGGCVGVDDSRNGRVPHRCDIFLLGVWLAYVGGSAACLALEALDFNSDSRGLDRLFVARHRLRLCALGGRIVPRRDRVPRGMRVQNLVRDAFIREEEEESVVPWLYVNVPPDLVPL
eukprot:CAMPEP_0180127966 /NCGR_PEP_ID=MMETSP0986-20121125/6504_1 /TAXON_ID=697907 /ORGANISM="non described non described, Strain CCMP2293" /LENGTH=164 /DNA_ID=CAMNT_0022067483 /DNA_START=191 /DNA_END=685 /DNA_ORIENTATION=-